MKSACLSRAALATATLTVALLAAASCAGGGSEKSTSTETKLPPGLAGTDSTGIAGSSYEAGSAAGDNTLRAGASDEEETGSGNASAGTSTVTKSVTLDGVEFTVVAAKRQDDNKLVASSGTREVSGDFLEVELKIRNGGDSLASLSRFSFRLWNPHINAASYDDYYGNVTTYGGYVSKNIISAALLDYASLQKVTATLRIGEELGDVFLFFDLNPLSVSRNDGFTKEGSNLVIYDTESGEKVEVNLAGFPD